MNLSEGTTTSEMAQAGQDSLADPSREKPAFPQGGVWADFHAEKLVTSGQGGTGASTSRPGGVANGQASPCIQLVFASCRAAVERALENADDPIERVNALNDLRHCLADLWKYRASRELQFADLINHLQGLLVEVEDLPLQQIQAIGNVIQKASYSSALTDPDLRDFTRILIKAGCDVFRELR